MQILLGVHETIVKINSDSIKIDYIQHYISTHFFNNKIQNNSILIPKSEEDSYHRVFLLKWLYALYSKKTKNDIPELKELLIKRQSKKIRIILKSKIIYKLIYSVVDSTTLNIQITPANHHIANAIKKHLGIQLILLSNSINIIIKSDLQKKLLQEFLNTKQLINVPHEHIFDKEKIHNFCTIGIKEKEVVLSLVDKAHLVLGTSTRFDENSLKKQYKKLAKKFHPDMAQDISTITLYTQKFQNIVNAYEILRKEVS